MLVKICGLRRTEHALAAAAAGATMLGLVFAPSRRQVRVEEAAVIAAAVRSLGAARPRLVGLFVNAPPAEVLRVAELVGLDLAQLSGDEPPEDAEAIPLPILKAVRLDGSTREAAWVTLAQQSATSAFRDLDERPRTTDDRSVADPRSPVVRGRSSVVLLVDAHVPGAYGGTGVVADWARAAELARRAPVLLAGGLTPANVAAAIAAVRPLGVDVSSGVESDGVKDPAKIEAFLGAARAAQ